MRRIYFKNEAEYENWQQANSSNDVWAVYNGNEEVCDILDDDHYYLYNLGFLDEEANIVPNLTPEQLNLFKENYGVDVFIIEERIKLTKKQLEAVKKYNEAVHELNEANVICVFKPFDDILAFNGEYIEDISYEDDYDDEPGSSLVNVDEAEVIAAPFGLSPGIFEDDSYVKVLFK